MKQVEHLVAEQATRLAAVAQAQDRLQFVFAVVRDRGDMLTKAQARLQDATNALHEWRWEDADGTVPTAKAKAVRHILPEPPGDL